MIVKLQTSRRSVSRCTAQACVAAVVPWLPPAGRLQSWRGHRAAAATNTQMRIPLDLRHTWGAWPLNCLKIKNKIQSQMLSTYLLIKVVTMFSCALSCCQLRVRFAKCCSQKWRLIPLFCWGYKAAHNSGLANGPGHGHMDPAGTGLTH